MSGCSRCEKLPEASSKEKVLYVAPPLSHTKGTLRRLLSDSDSAFTELADGILAVEGEPEDLRSLRPADPRETESGRVE